MKYRQYDIVKNDSFYIANSLNNNGYSSNGIYYLISSTIDGLKQQIDNEIKQLKQVK